MKKTCHFAILAVVGSLLFIPQSAQSQEKKYTRDEIDASLKYFDEDAVGKDEFKSRKTQVDKEILTLTGDFRKILRGDIDFTQNRGTLDKFMRGYYLPRMTHYDDTEIEFGRDRDRMIWQYLGTAKRNDARDYVLDSLILPYCKKICEGTYHPGSQVNAMSLIAALNRREAVKGDSPVPPVPMSQALAYMIENIDASKPLHLRVVALQGIERHTEIDGQLTSRRINAASRNGIRDRMLKVIDTPYTGKSNEDDVIYFQQRIATRILGNIGDPGASNDVAKKLISIIAGKQYRIWLKNDAVAAFAKLNFKTDADAKKVIEQMVDESVKISFHASRRLSSIPA